MAKVNQDGICRCDNILFIIPIIITIQGHVFEIYTMVSEMHVNVDMDLGLKFFIELEVESSMRELKLKIQDQLLFFLQLK